MNESQETIPIEETTPFGGDMGLLGAFGGGLWGGLWGSGGLRVGPCADLVWLFQVDAPCLKGVQKRLRPFFSSGLLFFFFLVLTLLYSSNTGLAQTNQPWLFRLICLACCAVPLPASSGSPFEPPTRLLLSLAESFSSEQSAVW